MGGCPGCPLIFPGGDPEAAALMRGCGWERRFHGLVPSAALLRASALVVRAFPQPQSPESIHRCCDIDEAWAGKVPR